MPNQLTRVRALAIDDEAADRRLLELMLQGISSFEVELHA